MANSSLRTFVLLVILHKFCSASQPSRIQISPDGGYSNIVIKFDNDVSQRGCSAYIKHLTEMITEASGVLARAGAGLGASVYYKQVTIVVPPAWTEADCRVKITAPDRGLAYQNADIRISRSPAVSPMFPHTQHSQGCGQAGEVITIPEAFLSDWNSTLAAVTSPAKVFVKEWAKLRYGVFDEHGYSGDKLYPNYYKVQGQFLHSGTSDSGIKGIWVTEDGAAECEDPASGLCVFSPQGENDLVTCSLGNIPQLASVSRWCGRNEVKRPSPPTKHNILCGSKTAAEIISEHRDFADRAGETGGEKLQLSLVPTFRIVREPTPRYVLMIETSAEMVSIWKWVRKAVQNFVRYQLAAQSSVAIVTFNTAAQVESRLVTLHTDTDRARVADTVPDSANKLGRTSTACISCAVTTAAGTLFNGNTAGAHLVVVSSGGWTGDRLQGDIMDSLKMSVISVSESDAFKSMAERSGGLYRSVREDSDMGLYTEMIGYLGEVLGSDPGHVSSSYPVMVHKQHVESGDVSSTFGTFTVDSDLGRDTEFGIYVEDDEDHQIKSVTFSDSKSNIYGPFTSMSSFYDSVNLKTINFNVGETPPFDSQRGSDWSYSIDWYNSDKIRDNVVLVTSRPRSSELIRVQTWTNMNKVGGNKITGDNLMAVFVQVTHGDSPVINANIEVNITVRMNNGSVARVNNLTMLDNGYGEPDTVAYDGIYSGYVTQYPGPGRYAISVRVTDNTGGAMRLTRAPDTRVIPSLPCCGSTVPISKERLVKIGKFSRIQEGLIVDVDTVEIPREETDKFIQPGKIGDLSIEVSNKSQLTMTWTAPGGDFNAGSVVTYRFVYSHNIEELVRIGTPPALDGLKRTDVAGTRVRHVINFPYYNQDYYIGVAASDAAGNRGAMSNIVLVNIAGPDTGGSEDSVSPSTGRGTDTNWVLIGAIIGGLSFLILSLVTIVCICRCCQNRKSRFSKDKFAKSLKSSGVKVEFPSPAQSETTDTSSYESEQQHQQQQQQHGVKPHSSTSFAANLTPTYWSASQLLGQHEMRHSADPGGPGAGHHGHQAREHRMSQQDLYAQNLVLPAHSQPDPAAIYSQGLGYYPGDYEVQQHNNYGYYGSEPADYHDYYYQGGQGAGGHRHSSASVDMYGHWEEPGVTTRPDTRPGELDLRNITQV